MTAAPRALVRLFIDGVEYHVAAGTSVAAALTPRDTSEARVSVTGEPRGPVCGMGVCFECRVTVDGVPHRRACLITVADGMRVDTASTLGLR